MILGAGQRTRPVVALVELTTESDATEPARATEPPAERLARFLTPRLHPDAPFDPWPPVASERPGGSSAATYAGARSVSALVS